MRRRSIRDEREIAGPGVRGPGAAALRAAPPEHQVGLAAHATSRTKGTSRAGSSEASQSQKQTMSAVAASSPAWQAAPKPRRGSWTTVAPRSRAMSAEPSVEPLSTTIARQPARDAVQHPGQRLGLVQTGQDDIDVGFVVRVRVITAFTLRT